ncbi:cob(I)yrinic acid a,c-diamide adenosyltransferase [Vibrio plantisponsor]|uniref:Cob(I)yrinic acid a,c-diamide adenosyltransferase n=1 Tax=Vibrio plantisponsor TaxID=664643 RepID=A0ABU4IF52_9VIBR|nr:cob(I)yrinic acid a,c-diamide adenosyltransferase [Vibrio plantisponsor]MDW6017106.1 cob(I)yrinic acid a,c-diamide adenosyltransferase [Vibrio plantisponsor]NNM40873.1 cob(I)yrinic acid a,c-diamide adenosyltransferase [Vibrio plantisponsor]
MGIYTKTGDKGTTSLVGGVRIAKTDIQVEAYGTVDELNANISVAQKMATVVSTKQLLDSIQYQLFYIGAELASPDLNVKSDNQQQVGEQEIKALEDAIDAAMAQVPALHSFVLPGSSVSGSQMHLARAVSRRAERRVLAVNEIKPVRPELMKYLNRLSDALYALARLEDHENQIKCVISKVAQRYQTLTANGVHHSSAQDKATQTALKLLQLAIAEAKQIGIPIVFALVDAHGNTILSYRMPHALLVSSELALKKAYTAVALKMATHELHNLVQPGQPLFQIEASCSDQLVSFGGGYPIFADGKIIGGIGISGGSVEEDMQIAQAALKGL